MPLWIAAESGLCGIDYAPKPGIPAKQKARLVTGFLNIALQPVAVRGLTAGANVAVLLRNMRRRIDASAIGNARQNRAGDSHGCAHGMVHAVTSETQDRR